MWWAENDALLDFEAFEPVRPCAGVERLVLDLFCGKFDFHRLPSYTAYTTHVMYEYTTDMGPAAMGEQRAAYRGSWFERGRPLFYSAVSLAGGVSSFYVYV
jgi:hypothetical protein